MSSVDLKTALTRSPALERSETMSLGYREPQTNKGTGQTEERLLDLREPVEPAPQPSEPMQPGDGPLHEPAEYAQPAAVLSVSLGQHRRDAQPAQHLPNRLRVVAAIALQPLWFLTLGTR